MSRFSGPDALRGIACCGVVLHHMAYFTPEAGGAVYVLARIVLGLGVPLFFMISAFAMSAAYEHKLSSSNEVRTYVIRRAMRIFPLYLLMLAVYMILQNPIQPDWSLSKTAIVLIFNLTLLFGLIPSIAHGLVWASWSISVECLFYILYPFIPSRFLKLGILIGLSVAGHFVSFSLSPYISPDSIDAPWFWAVAWYQYIPFFLLGIAAYLMQKSYDLNYLSRPLFLAGFIFISLIFATASFIILGWPFDEKHKIITAKYINLLIAFTPLLSLTLLVVTVLKPGIVVNRATIFLGKISYSIYLIHPLLVFSLISVYKRSQTTFGDSLISFSISAFLTFIILIPLSYLSYKFIEYPFIRFSKNITFVKL
jgi:peptidoglycan/LPS O-acetylase OafA/YrhL